ncbi:hypothetical protein HAHI6034_05805 [Hathewaya histolytica]|uniref:Uncharacterized protein n=1 Tax=Hathewaya histolytica TaxID=1498 RepID=A0A4U9RD59_HATHI|nr:hypothetical protein [Hathewaya histolytica]VTQ89682.1 Uncharacterised protein [Hathewaya histolytica]
MSKNNRNKKVRPVQETQENKPTLDIGNYIIEVISEGQVLKKIAVANSEINITKLSGGGLAVDLK